MAKSLTDPFHSLAIAAPNGPGDADRLLDTMLAEGWIGAVRRDVSGDLLAGEVRRPMGPWGLIVQLVGHPWLYIVGDDLQYEWIPQLARKLGVRAALFEYSGMTGTLLARAYERNATLFEFECGGFIDKGTSPSVTLKDGFRMTIQSPTHGAEWLSGFKDGRKAMDALARELDLYVPNLWHAGRDGKASVEGQPLKKGDIARVDLFVRGDASVFEPTQAAFDLETAIENGDAAGVRAALAAGADVRYLPGDDRSPLEQAIWLSSPYLEGGHYGKVSREQQLEVLAALLKAGANPNAPGQNPAIHNVLHWADTANSSDQLTTVRLLRLLLDRGADPNMLGTDLLSNGQRPLHVLVWKHQPLAVIKLLVSRGADAKLTNHAGRTPRQHAEARLQYVSGTLAKLPPAARAPAAAGADPLLDQTASFVKVMTGGETTDKSQVLSGMLANLRQMSARENIAEVERLEAAIAFLTAAEEGKADVSDIDKIAEASWQTHLKERGERDVQKTAALGMLLKGRESLLQQFTQNLQGSDDEDDQ